jgi:hypothetical protein
MFFYQDTRLALVHIPIHQYTSYIHAILKLLLPDKHQPDWEPPFINISVTPIEASIVLPRSVATQIFEPLLSQWPASSAAAQTGSDPVMTISPDDYSLMTVSGSGSSAAQRVIDLTTPLALAGISIFFITTYFADYILVPRRSQTAVVAALEARGFELSEVPGNQDISSSFTHRPGTAGSDGSGALAPGTPPPSTLTELQIKTFTTLRRKGIAPQVSEDIRLVQCAAQHQHRHKSRAMWSAVLQCLLDKPKYFSLTITETDPPSILLEQRCLHWFDEGDKGTILLGTNSDILIPIVLDLRTLPLESTGIVCGVAGRLAGGSKTALEGPVEMNYLSTTKAGSVMVTEEDLDRAVEILEQPVGKAETP